MTCQISVSEMNNSRLTEYIHTSLILPYLTDLTDVIYRFNPMILYPFVCFTSEVCKFCLYTTLQWGYYNVTGLFSALSVIFYLPWRIFLSVSQYDVCLKIFCGKLIHFTFPTISNNENVIHTKLFYLYFIIVVCINSCVGWMSKIWDRSFRSLCYNVTIMTSWKFRTIMTLLLGSCLQTAVFLNFLF